MEVIAEKDWIVSFPLKIDIHELLVWARREQCRSEGTVSNSPEHKTGLWWFAETHPLLKKRLEEITPLNPDWKSSIWEWQDGSPLLKHSDGVGRGASLVVVLIGQFEIFTHCPDTGEILDSYIYGPGQIVALKTDTKDHTVGDACKGIVWQSARTRQILMIPFVIMENSKQVGRTVIKDWFYKSSFPLHLLEELKAYVFPKLEGVKWQDCDSSQAPGSVWCLLDLPESLKQKMESVVSYKIYPDFYIWNYLSVKELKIHKDTNAPGAARQLAGVIPLVGDFETHIYDDFNFQEPLSTCKYGPGDILFLNNTKYYHGGRVLSPTRISMHFYFDFYNSENESLELLLKKNKLA